ncbi:hypothetical protein [Nocardia beijingensis]
MTATVRHPIDGDVHLRIWLGGRVFDFRAAPAAASAFCTEWRRKRREAIELVTISHTDMSLLPRLPCEQLFHDSYL